VSGSRRCGARSTQTRLLLKAVALCAVVSELPGWGHVGSRLTRLRCGGWRRSAHLSFQGEVEAHEAGKQLNVTAGEEEELHKLAEGEMAPIEEEEEEEEKDKKGYRVCAPQKLGPRPTLDGLSTTLRGHADRTDVFVHQGNYQKLLRGAMVRAALLGTPRHVTSIPRSRRYSSDREGRRCRRCRRRPGTGCCRRTASAWSRRTSSARAP